MNSHFSPTALFAGICALAAIAALNAWTSRINQFFFFARTLPAAFRETSAARAITLRYLGMICISAGLSMLLLTYLYVTASRPFSVSLVSALLAVLVGVTLSFAIAHRLAGTGFAQTAGAGSATETAPDRAISVRLLSTSPQATVRAMLSPVLAAVCLWLGGVATSNYSMSSFTNTAGQQGGAVLLGMASGMLLAGTAMRLMLRFSARPRTTMASYITRVMALLSWVAVALIGVIMVAARMHEIISGDVAHMVMLVIVAMAAVSIV